MTECMVCDDESSLKQFVINNITYPESLEQGQEFEIEVVVENVSENEGGIYIDIIDNKTEVCLVSSDLQYIFPGYTHTWTFTFIMPNHDVDWTLSVIKFMLFGSNQCQDYHNVKITLSQPTPTGAVCAHSNIDEGAVTVKDENENEVLNVIGKDKDCKVNLPVGEYCAYWTSVEGYKKPSQQCKTLTKDDTITFYGEYIREGNGDTGTICAHSNINDGAVTVKDENENEVLRVIGKNIDCKTSLPIGEYCADWITVEGYHKPKQQCKTLTKDDTITFYGIYEKIGKEKTETDYLLIIIILIIVFLGILLS